MIDVMIAMCGKRLTGALRILLALIMEATDVKSLETESCAVVEVLREDCRADWMVNNAPFGVSSLPSEITSCFISVLPALLVGPGKRNTRKAWLSKLHGQFESWMKKWKPPRVLHASNPLLTTLGGDAMKSRNRETCKEIDRERAVSLEALSSPVHSSMWLSTRAYSNATKKKRVCTIVTTRSHVSPSILLNILTYI